MKKWKHFKRLHFGQIIQLVLELGSDLGSLASEAVYPLLCTATLNGVKREIRYVSNITEL